MKNLATITRANFLPLTIVIVSAGLAAAYYTQRQLRVLDALLVLFGALLKHVSVNTFNNYFDYRSGIDKRTIKTPFSGGVEILVRGQMKPTFALLVASTSLVAAALIGIYFLTRMFSVLLPMVLYGAFVIVLYTPVLSKIYGLSEIVAGSGFGLMGLGTYASQTSHFDATGFAVFLPVTILVALLLFLNEFPDAEIDKIAGRRHLVILLGKRTAAWIYVGGLIATYAVIVLAVALRAAPSTVLMSLLTIPLAYRAGRIATKNYARLPELMPALGMNVIIILTTISLIALGFSLAAYL